MDDAEIYDLIGEDGFARLVHAFYAQVPGDDILGTMYPAHDLAGAEQRLRGLPEELRPARGGDDEGVLEDVGRVHPPAQPRVEPEREQAE